VITREPRGRAVAALGVAGAAAAAAGTFLDWYTIEIGGITAAGGSATGWEGRDGRTVVAAAVVAAIAAVLVLLGSRKLAPKLALIVAGGVTGVIAVAGILDASNKAEKVQDEFAIAPDRVSAEVGVGLWLVLAGGLAEATAGVVTRTPE
jgi:hypothetical protein